MEELNKEKFQFCLCCATGNIKIKHSLDKVSCRQGRKLWYYTLSNEDQMKELRKTQIPSQKLADHIWSLSVERDMSPMHVLMHEGLDYLV